MKVAKEGSEAKTSEGGGVEDECGQLSCDARALEREHAKLAGKQRELERKLKEQERKVEKEWRKLETLRYQLRPLRREVEQVQRKLLMIEEIGNTQRPDKLPRELWEKILDHLDENDLFPLALSCRYFRQKQKELVARPRQSGKPCLALQTDFRWQKLKEGKPVSADYLWFCYKEKVSKDVGHKKARWIRCLVAYHGHLPLLQELLEPSESLEPNCSIYSIASYAGESSLSLSSLLWLLTSLSLSLLHSARRPTGDLEVAENSEAVGAG